MEATDITLSIVMPVFNHRDDVATMIDSVCANDFTAWEMLAVDDGSDAETLAMLTRYAEADSRIRVVKRDRQPKGAQTCRNIGLEMARGEYVVFFDSDDYVAPYCLGQRVEQMRRHTELDFMVFPSGMYMDDTFRVEAHPYMYGYKIYADDVAQFARRELPFIVWNNIYRRASLLSKSLKWDERLLSLQDADFNISALAAGLHYAYAEDARPDYGYRIASVSSVSKNIKGVRHHESHVYANHKMWTTVQTAYGSRYDSALFDGTLNIYNAGLSGRGIDRAFALSLVASLKDRSSTYYRLFNLQVRLTLFLQHIVSAKVARQLPMALYLAKMVRKRKQKAAKVGVALSTFNSKNQSK